MVKMVHAPRIYAYYNVLEEQFTESDKTVYSDLAYFMLCYQNANCVKKTISVKSCALQ